MNEVQTAEAEQTLELMALSKYGEIIQSPDARLSRACKPVDDEFMESGEVFHVLLAMKSLVAKYGGIGLAANQVGSDRRLIVISMKDNTGNHVFIDMINPVILSKSGSTKMEEGCLSVGKGRENYVVKRSKRIHVKFDCISQPNENNEVDLIEMNGTFDGVEAVAIQHEIDHLNGIVINKIGKKVSQRPAEIQ